MGANKITVGILFVLSHTHVKLGGGFESNLSDRNCREVLSILLNTVRFPKSFLS